MNITTPEEMSSGISKFEEAISNFEHQFAKQDKDEEYYHLIISGEYNRNTCEEIQKAYLSAGWKKVVCMTSSENVERGGLTSLKLWKNEQVLNKSWPI